MQKRTFALISAGAGVSLPLVVLLTFALPTSRPPVGERVPYLRQGIGDRCRNSRRFFEKMKLT